MTYFDKNAKVFKALSNKNRLKIIDILSNGEQCACDISKHFEFTQPTLSHHMKILANLDLVKIREDGIWNYYSLNIEKYAEITKFLSNLFHGTETYIDKL